MTYNRKRHIELLKRAQDLKNQGKNLFRENPKEDSELFKYNIAVEQHIFWQSRDQLALLMEDFLNEKIDVESFCYSISKLRNTLLNTYDKFNLELISDSEQSKNFQPDERATKLHSRIVSYLYYQCEIVEDVDDYSKKEFYDDVKNAFSYLQEDLNKE